MRFNKLIALALVLLLVLVGAACGKQEEKEATPGETKQENGEGTQEGITFPKIDRTQLGADKVVATYDGGEVKGDELAQYIAVQAFFQPNYPVNDPEFQKQAVEFLIAEKSIQPLTSEKEQTAAKEKVDQMWDQIFSRYDEPTRERGYKELGITEDDIRKFLTSYFVTEAYFKSQVTEEDVTKLYEEVKPQLTTASVRHILVATEERQPDGTSKPLRSDEEAKKKADELYNQLVGGADFAKLATEHTDDPGSKETGGLYKDAPVAQWVPEFKEAALKQEINAIGKPVKTDFGYHIIRVESREEKKLEEVREQLVAQASQEKLMNYYENDLQKKNIQVKLGEKK